MLLVGLRGTGKTQLVRSLLAMGDNDGVSDGTAGTADGPDAFAGATERVEVSVGNIMGVTLKLIDTPGLTAGAAGTAANASVLRQLRAAHRRFSPDLVVYVDRHDTDCCVYACHSPRP
jgi:septin family protein